MRKTIYIKDEGLWDKLKELAEANEVSISEMLLSPWRGTRRVTKTVEDRLDRIDEKLEGLLGILKGLNGVTGKLIDLHNPIHELRAAMYHPREHRR